MAELESVEIAFVCDDMIDEDIDLLGVYGREELSRLFELKLILAREKPFANDELDTLLHSACSVALGPGDHDVIHGLLERVELIDAAGTVASRYLATMVPTVRLLDITKSCRIYQDQNTIEMIESVLQLYGFVTDEDYQIRIHAELPKREYVVQYQESDWQFIQRWLEHEGMFFWFEHGQAGEVLVIADENEDTTPIGEPSIVSYRERNNLATGREATVWNWQLHQQRVAARVSVLDYNYRTPSVPLGATETIDDKRGFGSLFHYGEHFKSLDDGKRLAKIRAEGVRCQQRTYTARSDCARFRVGHTFELENHHDAQHDGRYLITAIEHRVGYPVRTNDVEDYLLEQTEQRYFARVTAIPYDVPFRPERRTPWPRIYGTIHGHVEGDTDGENAEIDDQGRYKVRLPFDTSDEKGLRSSRWIRMAQPYAGGGYGTHFPLHRGTEVLLTHIDGDPDRPVIMGAVPNPQTVSPSTATNATQSVIQTASGVRIEMEDQA